MPTDQHDNNWALIQACKNNNLEEVRRLLPISNPQAHQSTAVAWAARCGCIEMVQLLAPLSNLQSDKCFAVQAAASSDQVEVLQYLLEYDIPQATLNDALELVAYKAEIIKLLLPGSNYSKVLHDIQKNNAERATYGQINTTVLEQCIEEYDIELQRQRLETAVGSSKPSRARKI